MIKKHLLTTSIIAILALIILPTMASAEGDNETNLNLTDLTGTTFSFTYTQLLAMPRTDVDADLYCDGALLTYGNWNGVALNYLLNQAHFTSEVGSIQLTASDGYQVAIPLDLAVKPQIIIAYELNNQPLTEGLRLVIPDANGAAWISKITSITMSTAGAPYPQPISVGGIKEKIATLTTESTPKPSPTQQETPNQPQPTNPENSSSSFQEVTPTNTTQSNPPATNTPVSNQNLNMQSTLYLVGVACAITFTIVAFMVFRRRRKL